MSETKKRNTHWGSQRQETLALLVVSESVGRPRLNAQQIHKDFAALRGAA
jgi:hypothetical protein